MKKEEKRKIKILRNFIYVFPFLIIVLYIVLHGGFPTTLKINEISFVGNQGIDWIEIYNPTMNNLSLENLYLSDNKKNFQKFRIKDPIIVPRHGFVTIYCKGADDLLEDVIKTNFNIANGETIYLIAQNGSNVIDSMTAISEQDIIEGASIGRFPDGNEDLFIMSESTPGDHNKKDFIIF